jgi:hypothetical protein
MSARIKENQELGIRIRSEAIAASKNKRQRVTETIQISPLKRFDFEAKELDFDSEIDLSESESDPNYEISSSDESEDDSYMEEDRPDDKLHEAVKKYLTSLRTKILESKSTRANSPWVVPPYAPYQNSEKVQLSVYLSPRVFVWKPHHELPGLQSLKCTKDNCKGVLSCHGMADWRPIIDFDEIIYLLSQRYMCTICKKTVTASESEFLSSLPLHISSHFPFILMRRGGVTKSVATGLMNLDEKGVGPTPFRKLLLEMHSKKFHEKELHYYSACNALNMYRSSHGSVKPLGIEDFPLFPDFKDLITIPRSNFFKGIFVHLCKQQEPYWDYMTHRLDSRFIKVDESYKVSYC